MAPGTRLHAAPPAAYSSENAAGLADARLAATPAAAAPPADEPAPAEQTAVVAPAATPKDGRFSFRLWVLHDPSDFYGHLLAMNSALGVPSDLPKELNQRATISPESQEETVTSGAFWMGQCDENWHRVRVVEVMQTSHGRAAKGIGVDYGNRRTLHLLDIGAPYIYVSPCGATRLCLEH